MSESEMRELLEKVDVDGDGKISLEEAMKFHSTYLGEHSGEAIEMADRKSN